MENRPNVLIVDDNISLCKTLSFVLRHKGYTVTTAKDGPEAIVSVKEQPFDVIFLDIKMLPMNGVETYKMIKRIRSEAVVVMITAWAVEDLVHEALREGAHEILYKPLDIEEVIAVSEEARGT